jgi:erythronate-4-phosphate dehydrogenase
MTNADLKDCECLLVRSVTRVNQDLLENTLVRFVASATIGTDHIDLDYLESRNIGFANAPGCNAESASEYVINALFALAERRGFNPFELKAGIIGCGNVGSRVKKKLDSLGIPTLINDPPLQQAGDQPFDFVSLDQILTECNFITLHVPLTRDGEHPTFHLFDADNLNQLKPNTILFNAARGPVIDNIALLKLIQQRQDLTIFLDTWEGEPSINHQLLQAVDLATPHIAGYSVEGKLRGTRMISDAAHQFFGQQATWQMSEHLPDPETIELTDSEAPLQQLLRSHYDVFSDHQRLLALADLDIKQSAEQFDLLRKQYPKRYEYDHYRVKKIASKKTASQIERLNFKVS